MNKLLDSLTPQDSYYFLQDAAKCHSPTVWRLAATFFVTKQMRTPKIISHHDGKNQAYSLQDTDTIVQVHMYIDYYDLTCEALPTESRQIHF